MQTWDTLSKDIVDGGMVLKSAFEKWFCNQKKSKFTEKLFPNLKKKLSLQHHFFATLKITFYSFE